MHRIITAFMLTVLVGHPLAAQGPRALPPGTAWGITLDQFDIASEYRFTSVTLHITSLHPNKLTPEFGLVVVPGSLGEGGVVTNLDLGGGLNLVLPVATLLVRGGASGIFAFGSGGGGALPGLHYGASLLVKMSDGVGLRLDLLRRVYVLPFDLTNQAPTTSIGIGITSLPRASDR